VDVFLVGTVSIYDIYILNSLQWWIKSDNTKFSNYANYAANMEFITEHIERWGITELINPTRMQLQQSTLHLAQFPLVRNKTAAGFKYTTNNL